MISRKNNKEEISLSLYTGLQTKTQALLLTCYLKIQQKMIDIIEIRSFKKI